MPDIYLTKKTDYFDKFLVSFKFFKEIFDFNRLLKFCITNNEQT